jgi:hypothetical protein
MDDPRCPAAITIRRAVAEDTEGIARTFLESAEYHARLDPECYLAFEGDREKASQEDSAYERQQLFDRVRDLLKDLEKPLTALCDSFAGRAAMVIGGYTCLVRITHRR